MNIVFFSAVPWNSLWTRPQQIVMLLAYKGHNIVYFQDPIYLAPASLIKSYGTNNFFVTRRIMKNLRIVNMFVPFQRRFEFVDKKLGALAFRVYLKCFNFKPNAAIFYSYPYSFLIDTLKGLGIKTIYDCPDEESSGTKANVLRVLKAEKNLSVNSSAVFAVSRSLCAKISKFNPNCFYVPNGADFEHFSKALKIRERPQDISQLQNPIIGYIGAVYEWVNIDLICRLAESHPEYSILIVGPVLHGMSKLKKHANIITVGHKKYSFLPQYLASMDVCLIPFKINALTLASNPIKLFEYLAAGKPVVSTALPEVNNCASGLVYISKNDEDFIKKVEEALGENRKSENAEVIMKRIDFAKNNSWEKRIETIEKIMRVHC
ncbi:glycosyltransferase family 1 protein [Candidatus Bathyarchaeota archaeon A05DMB-2]|jgi:glycosyltransferase involved in cell wall biosynthesis|nr:glycosyltransferase family 1 protein [Candidatus Bathyarchaeota archaeon A05DMB-2]